MNIPTELNSYPVIQSDTHAKCATVMMQKPHGEYVVATWWPELKTTWQWGHSRIGKKQLLTSKKRNGEMESGHESNSSVGVSDSAGSGNADSDDPSVDRGDDGVSLVFAVRRRPSILNCRLDHVDHNRNSNSFPSVTRGGFNPPPTKRGILCLKR